MHQTKKKIHEVLLVFMTNQRQPVKSILNEINNKTPPMNTILQTLVEILSSKGVKINCIQANPD